MAFELTNLEMRAAHMTGIVIGYVPGFGGDVWFVKHSLTNDVVPYSYEELERDVSRQKQGQGVRLPKGLRKYIRFCKQNGISIPLAAQLQLDAHKKIAR